MATKKLTSGDDYVVSCLHAHQEGGRPTGPTDTLSQDQKPAKRTKSLKKVRTSKGH